MTTCKRRSAGRSPGIATALVLCVGFWVLLAGPAQAQNPRYQKNQQVHVRTKLGAFNGPIKQGTIFNHATQTVGTLKRILHLVVVGKESMIVPEEYVRSVAEYNAGQQPPAYPDPRQELTTLINTQRHRTGNSTLKTDSILQATAQSYAELIANKYGPGKFVGDEADGKTPVQRVKGAFQLARQPYPYGNARGDRLAELISYGPSVALVAMYGNVVGWEDSKSHWAILNHTKWTQLGIGVAAYPKNPDSNVWVVLFGAEERNVEAVHKTITEELIRAKAKSGDVQISLHWTNKSDLDLHVVCPSGETISYVTRKSKCGGELDIDKNSSSGDAVANAVENVYWPRGKAPRGKYKVYVHFFSNHNNGRGCLDPSPFDVRIVVQDRAQVFHGTVGSTGNRKVLVREFELR